MGNAQNNRKRSGRLLRPREGKRASRVSRQNACASLFWHDRGAAADAKGVKSTTTIQEPSVATGCLQTVITEAKREALAPFGFDDIVVKFSTRPEKRVGSNEIWDKAEAALAEATKLAGLDYILNPGEGAFYGPKSVQNECRRKMLAFFYDRVQPRTPSASTSNSR